MKISTADKIMNVAEPLILKEGFHGVSVDKIIELAGVSKGTFFYHFKSKEMLAVSLLERFLEKQGARLENVLLEAKAKYGDDGLAILLSFCKTYSKVLESETCLDGCVLNAFVYQLGETIPKINDVCDAAIDGWLALFSPLFFHAISQGGMYTKLSKKARNEKAQQLALQLFYLLEGSTMIVKLKQKSYFSDSFKLFSDQLTRLCSD